MEEKIFSGTILDEEHELTLTELIHACSCREEWIIELVSEGVIDPVGTQRAEWRFTGLSLLRARRATRLQRDLGVNPAGIALALDLMDEMEALRIKLERLNM